jgi:hypothetical protein
MGAGRGRSRRATVFLRKSRPITFAFPPSIEAKRTSEGYEVSYDVKLMPTPRFQKDELVASLSDTGKPLRVVKRREQMVITYMDGRVTKVGIAEQGHAGIGVDEDDPNGGIRSVDLEYSYELKDDISGETSNVEEGILLGALEPQISKPGAQLQIDEDELQQLQF